MQSDAMKFTTLVVFALGDQCYGLNVAAVERVERAVEINPLPQSPEIVAGVINMRGRVIPIMDIRRRFRKPQRELAVSDQIIIARTIRRTVGLVVDEVIAVNEYLTQDIAAAKDVLPALEYVEGVVKMQDGLILIHDLDKFLSLEEEMLLTRSMETN